MTDKYNCLYFSGEKDGKRWNDKKTTELLKKQKRNRKKPSTCSKLKFSDNYIFAT